MIVSKLIMPEVRRVMLQLCLCDDDKLISDRMTPLIYAILEKYQVQVTFLSSGESFLFHFRDNPNFIDIILMDIEMGGQNGIEVMKEMRAIGCTSELIYLTTMRDYVFDSFDTLPLNYILKTEQNLDKFQSALLAAAANSIKKKNRFLMIGSSKNSVKAEKTQVLYIEATNRQILFHLLGGTSLEYSGSLQLALEMAGPDEFSRIHKSYVVNLHNVRQIRTTSLILLDGTELPLGRKFVADVRNRFSAFLSKNTIEV